MKLHKLHNKIWNQRFILYNITFGLGYLKAHTPEDMCCCFTFVHKT